MTGRTRPGKKPTRKSVDIGGGQEVGVEGGEFMLEGNHKSLRKDRANTDFVAATVKIACAVTFFPRRVLPNTISVPVFDSTLCRFHFPPIEHLVCQKLHRSDNEHNSAAFAVGLSLARSNTTTLTITVCNSYTRV